MDEELSLEIPPPMKPLLKSTVISKSNSGNNSNELDELIVDRVSAIAIKSQDDLAEIEQIVKEKIVCYIF